MADKRKDRRWMRRGAKAWYYNGAWNASGVEPVTLLGRVGGWWEVAKEGRHWSADASDLYRTHEEALLGLRDQMRRHCFSVEKRIAEVDETIEQLRRSKTDG